jgi:putative tryptophan/tyrosine transport system substrate-binding protein
MIRRRDFITLLGSAAAWPLAARAQQRTMPVIGWLNSASPSTTTQNVAAFRQGLADAGTIEGQNASIEFRWAEGRYDRLPALAADLVRRNVAVIATTSGIPPALAAKAATTTIPIVFIVGIDPIEAGLVASLNRPGGNLTGVSILNVELAPKRLELLHELVPAATLIALLVNPANPNFETLSRDLQAAARTLRLQLHVLRASTERELDMVFATWTQLRAGGLVIGPDTFFVSRTEQITALALRHAVPTISLYREFAEAGGLMSYGGNGTDAVRLAGVYCGRILKGERPADLPIQQSTKVELVINLKTAKALNLTVPLALQASADELIE